MVTGSRIKALDDAAKSYYSVLAENRKMHNELQELKGAKLLLTFLNVEAHKFLYFRIP